MAVIARPDERWGERPIVVVKPTGDVMADDLCQFLQPRVAGGAIASYWIPDTFEFVDDIPLTSAGKINKIALSEQFAK